MMILDYMYSYRGTMKTLACLSMMLYVVAGTRKTKETIDHIEQNGTNDTRNVFRVLSRKNVTKWDRVKRLAKLGHGTQTAKQNWKETEIRVEHVDDKEGKFVVTFNGKKPRRVDKIRASNDSKTYKGYKLVLKKQTKYNATNVYIKEHPEYPAQCSQLLQLLLNNGNYKRKNGNLQSFTKQSLQIAVANPEREGAKEIFDQKIFFNEKGIEDLVTDYQHCAAGRATEETVFIGFGSFWRVFDALKDGDGECCVSVSAEREKPELETTIRKMIGEVYAAAAVEIRGDPLQEKIQTVKALIENDHEVIGNAKEKLAKLDKKIAANKLENIPVDIADLEMFEFLCHVIGKSKKELEPFSKGLEFYRQVQLMKRKDKLARLLKSLGPEESIISLIREVQDNQGNHVKPAWAAGVLNYLNDHKKDNEEEFKYVLDFGTKKVSLTDQRGVAEEAYNHDYNKKYDYGKKDNGQTVKEQWSMEKYFELVKTKIANDKCVARFTGNHRPVPGKKDRADTALFMSFLKKHKIEAKLLAIEDEAFFGSRNAFSIMQPFFPEAKKFKVLEIGSGSNQIGEFTLQKHFRQVRRPSLSLGGDANAAEYEPENQMYVCKDCGANAFCLSAPEKCSSCSKKGTMIASVRRRLTNRPIHKLEKLIQQAQA